MADHIIAPPISDAATNQGMFRKPADIAAAGDPFLIVGVETGHAGRFGTEVVHAILIKDEGPARVSFSQTPRREKHARDVAERLRGSVAVGPFRLTPHEFEGRAGDLVTTYVFTAHDDAGPVVLADYQLEA